MNESHGQGLLMREAAQYSTLIILLPAHQWSSAPSRPLCWVLSDLPWQEIRCPAKAGVPLAAPGHLVSMLASSSLPSAYTRQWASMYPPFCDVHKGEAPAESRVYGVTI